MQQLCRGPGLPAPTTCSAPGSQAVACRCEILVNALAFAYNAICNIAICTCHGSAHEADAVEDIKRPLPVLQNTDSLQRCWHVQDEEVISLDDDAIETDFRGAPLPESGDTHRLSQQERDEQMARHLQQQFEMGMDSHSEDSRSRPEHQVGHFWVSQFPYRLLHPNDFMRISHWLNGTGTCAG